MKERTWSWGLLLRGSVKAKTGKEAKQQAIHSLLKIMPVIPVDLADQIKIRGLD